MKNKNYICGTDPFCSILNKAAQEYAKTYKDLKDMVERPFIPFGAVIATCELVEVSNPISLATSWHGCTEHWRNKHCFSLGKTERAFGDFSEGRFMWLLENIKILDKPIPAKGALGLWEWQK